MPHGCCQNIQTCFFILVDENKYKTRKIIFQSMHTNSNKRIIFLSMVNCAYKIKKNIFIYFPEISHGGDIICKHVFL